MRNLLPAAAVALLTGVACPGAGAVAPPAPKELERLWADLGTKDPVRADRAMTGLAASPAQAIPFLEKRLRPVPAPDPRRLADWLAGLDSEEFAVRERAARELRRLGEVAEPFLQRALRGATSAEVRHRVRGLLDAVRAERLNPSAERLRAARAIEVLERVGDRSARRALASLAGGAPEAQLTVEAKSALRRLTQSDPDRP
jgi:hypothetical protein